MALSRSFDTIPGRFDAKSPGRHDLGQTRNVRFPRPQQSVLFSWFICLFLSLLRGNPVLFANARIGPNPTIRGHFSPGKVRVSKRGDIEVFPANFNLRRLRVGAYIGNTKTHPFALSCSDIEFFVPR